MISEQFTIGLLLEHLTEAVRPRVTRRNVDKLYGKYIYVESSNIHSIYYSPDDKTMRVRFLSGAEYEYYRVPERIFIALLNADSHGSEFWDLVRDIFRYDRLADFDVGAVTQDNEELPIQAR